MKKFIDEAVFNGVKTMVDHGIPSRTIADIMDVSQSTVSRIGRSATLEEYKSLVIREKCNVDKVKTEKKKEPEQTNNYDTMQFNYQANRVYNAITEQTEVLRLVLEKLTIIANELV